MPANSPCLPECERNCCTGEDKHALGCPNTYSAKAPEPVRREPHAKPCECSEACITERMVEIVLSTLEGLTLEERAERLKKMEAAVEQLSQATIPSNGETGHEVRFEGEGAPQAAERSNREAAPASLKAEEPIDLEARLLEDYGLPDHAAAAFDAKNVVDNWEPQDCDEQDLNNARAYLALKAENADLRRRIAVLESGCGTGVNPKPQP